MSFRHFSGLELSPSAWRGSFTLTVISLSARTQCRAIVLLVLLRRVVR